MSFEGILPAVTTPFDEHLALDLDALATNVRYLISAGVHGIIGTGTMGESGSLSRAERQQVLETIVATVNGRIPVLAGVAATTAAVATDYISDAAAAGVSGLMVLPPLLYAGDEAEITAYFRSVCGAADLPVVAYNNPQAAGYDLSAEFLVRLSVELEPVVQVKECSGDARRVAEILGRSDGSLRVLAGGDDWAFEALAVGADGWISGVADVLPEECVALYGLIQRGELDQARALYQRLLPMARFDMTPKLVQYYKAGLDEIGLTGGPSRPPRLELTPVERESLVLALALIREPAAA